MFGEATRSGLLVGADGSVASDAAVGWAAREATVRRLQIELVKVVAPVLVGSTKYPNHTITRGQEGPARQIRDQVRRIIDQLAGEKHRNWSR
jgi:nucleotide-binding universal stress UspA family protein